MPFEAPFLPFEGRPLPHELPFQLPEGVEQAAMVGEVVPDSPAIEKDFQLKFALPASPLELQCDRARLEMALSNLLDNALKFTPPGGEVEIGARQVGETVRFWVRDSGPGIHSEDLPHIFERFYRGRNRHAGGSGLSLAIVQSVVHAHGGRVCVESASQECSTFFIECPMAPSYPPASGDADSVLPECHISSCGGLNKEPRSREERQDFLILKILSELSDFAVFSHLRHLEMPTPRSWSAI